MTSSLRNTIAAALALALVVAFAVSGNGRAVAARDLVVAMADDVVLDPHRAPLPGSWVAARLVHRGLYAFPHEAYPTGSSPVPDLALEPVRQLGSARYEIPLRDATFSNGRVMTPQDVVASLQRFARIRVAAGRYTSTFRAIEVPDPQPSPPVVRIRTSRTMPDLAWLLAHPQAAILPASTADRVGVLGPVGLGPYRVASRALERNVVLERNSRWEAADDPVRTAPADRVILRIRGSGAAAFEAVGTGAADLVGDPGPPDVLDASTAPVHAAGRCTRFVAIDHRAPGLDVLGNRRAIRDALEGITLDTAGTAPAASLLPPLVEGARDRSRAAADRQIAIARELRLAGSDTRRDRAELGAIARRLRAAGAQIALERRPAALHVRLANAPSAARPDLVLLTWCAEWPGLAGRTFLEALTGPGRLAPRSPTLQEAIVAALAASDEDAEPAWQRADAILRDSAVLVPVGWPSEPAAFRTFSATPMTSPMFPQGDPSNAVPSP